MSDYYSNKLLAGYFLNAVRIWNKEPQRMLSMANVASTHSSEFGVKYRFPVYVKKLEKEEGKKPKTETKAKTRLSKKDIEQLEDYFSRVVAKYEKSTEPPEYEFLNRFLSHLDFNKTDIEIAKLLFFATSNPFEMFFNDISRETKSPASPEVIAAFLGRDKKEMMPHLKMSSPLMNSGIIYMNGREYDGSLIDDRITYFLHHRLVEAIDAEEFDIQAATDRLVGKSVKPETEWEDFEHIKDEAEYAARIVKGALASHAKGVNILVYGDTGTGKTAFCQTLAAHLEAPLYATGEKPDDDDSNFDNDGNRLNRSAASARLADKRLVENMLMRRESRALTMFDEMEDVLGNDPIRLSTGVRSSFQLGKAATNSLLTENEIPCLWTTNNIDRFDPALLRRFSFAIELKTPNAEIRQRVIVRTLKRCKCELTVPEIQKLAGDHAVPPALYSKAIETASLAAGSDAEDFLSNLKMGLRASARIVTGNQTIRVPKPVEHYDLGLVNADQDLADLSNRIIKGRHLNFSMCGYGVSGAGKSEYMVHLADRLGIEALLVPYSDVGSSYVSETEQNIRRKFEQASDERKFLIFDEADSLLYDRRGAGHSWERSVVNEMLTRMERHEYPMGCTTNLMSEMDQASLRRFIFKIRFNALRPEQAQQAYRVFFKHEPPASVNFPDNIAPGDFANVLKQAKLLDIGEDPKWLISALKSECTHKEGVRRPIGFSVKLDEHYRA